MEEFKVGDRVHLKLWCKEKGYGTITEINREHNSNWIWFDAIYVEYEEPLPGEWPYQNRVRRRGRHFAGELEHA